MSSGRGKKTALELDKVKSMVPNIAIDEINMVKDRHDCRRQSSHFSIVCFDCFIFWKRPQTTQNNLSNEPITTQKYPQYSQLQELQELQHKKKMKQKKKKKKKKKVSIIGLDMRSWLKLSALN